MGKLNDFDFSAIETLIEKDVLQDEDVRYFPLDNGVIIIPCSDGDQMPDLFAHESKVAKETGATPRPHMPSLHGGAMLIAEDCPLYREHKVDELLLTHIKQAESMKDIHTIILYIHTPCGAAGLAKLNVIQQIQFLMRAKERVKALNPKNKIICKVHVDYGDRRDEDRRTYFLSYDRWAEFWEKEGKELWG